MDDEVILHNHPISPFSEKIRLVLAYKQIPWWNVEQPVILPKPKVMPLTGGYRRTPVLQMGADIYCDTALIARRLNELKPEPSLYPAFNSAAALAIEDWADHRFFWWAILPVFKEVLPSLPPEFMDDRKRMLSFITPERIRADAPHALSQLEVSLDRLEATLTGQEFIVGDRLSIADIACYHPLWYAVTSPRMLSGISARMHLFKWFKRIEAIKAPATQAMDADHAIEIAKRNQPRTINPWRVKSAGSFARGVQVSVAPDDCTSEPTVGSLAHLSNEEIVILRNDDLVGEVAVHFPRLGYKIELR
jgi:glutathione S-transferase